MSNHDVGVPDWLTESLLENVLRKALNNKDLKIENAIFNPGSAVGENYTCKIFRILVTYVGDATENSSNINVIAKIKPNQDLIDKINEGLDFDNFETETQFYNSLQSKYDEVLQQVEKSIYDFTPRCYMADLATDGMLLEDLRARNFVKQPRGVDLNLQQLLKAVETIANFHGAGLLLLEENPMLKKQFSSGLYRADLKGQITKFVNFCCEKLRDNVDKVGFKEKYVVKLKALRNEVENGSLKIMEFKDGDFHVINHGDGWQNNMMFHYNDGIVDQIILFDFQTLNYNCFANDLQHTIFMAGGAEDIVNNIDMILEKYFLTLKQFLPDSRKISLSRIKAEFKDRYYFGYLIASIFRPLELAKTPIDFEAMIDGSYTKDIGFSNPKYKTDMDIFLPFFEDNGIFN